MKTADWSFTKQNKDSDGDAEVERAIHETVRLTLNFDNPYSGKPSQVEKGDAVVIGLKRGSDGTILMVDNGLDYSVSVEVEEGIPKFVYDDARPGYVVIDMGDLYQWFTKQQIVSMIGEALLDLRFHKMLMMTRRELENDVGTNSSNIPVGGN